MPGLNPAQGQFPMLMSGLNNTMPSQTAEEQLLQMFAQMQNQIQNQPAPQMEQVPQAPNPLQAFLSQALGNVGSALAWNPQYSAQAERAIGEARDSRAGAEQRNVQRQNIFDLERQKAMLDLSQKRLDLQLGRLGEGDFAEKKKLEDYRAAIKRHQDDIQFQRDMALIGERSAKAQDEEKLRQQGYRERRNNATSPDKKVGGRATKGWSVEWRQKWGKDDKDMRAAWDKAIRREQDPGKKKKMKEDREQSLNTLFERYDKEAPNHR